MALVAKAARAIGMVADTEAVLRVVSHNPDSLWAISRRTTYDARIPKGEGLVAFLMLNEQGLRQLAAGTFDAMNPNLALLTRQNEKPAAIYVWAVYAPGVLATGVRLVFEKISSPMYRDVNLYARAATDDGFRFLNTLGFKQGARIDGMPVQSLHVLDRTDKTGLDVPIYDTYRHPARKGTVSVTIARTLEDLLKVSAIRSAVYIAEQECPYDEEFDGNDLCATHLIGYLGDEPAGCIRIRFFAGFAKLERVAIRHEFRRSRLVFRLIRASIELCRAKGYGVLYGHPRKDLIRFYRHFGFELMQEGREFRFSGVDYVEMILRVEPHDCAISLGIDPYIIIRPEGCWHRPGVLERSMLR